MLMPGGSAPVKGLLSAAKGDGLWTGQHLGGYGGGLANFMGDGKSARIKEIKAGPYSPQALQELKDLGYNTRRADFWAKGQQLKDQAAFAKKVGKSDLGMVQNTDGSWSESPYVKGLSDQPKPVVQTNINELTETVIQENNQAIAEQTDPVRIKEKIAPVTPIPTMEANPSKPSPQDLGSHDAVPKIKLSPYFVEYTKTSSY